MLGMCIAVQPMTSLETWETEILEYGLSAFTAERSIFAHFEHTVPVNQNEPEILTKLRESIEMISRIA